MLNSIPATGVFLAQQIAPCVLLILLQVDLAPIIHMFMLMGFLAPSLKHKVAALEAE